MTTEQRLKEIEERDSKATKGPWRYQEKSDAYTHIVRAGNSFIVQFGQDTTGVSESNARFTAGSRQDIPFLLALVKKQREALEAIRDAKVCVVGLRPSARGHDRHMADEALNFNPEDAK